MYIPPHFEITDKNEIFSFVEANSFGQLISTLQGKLFSSHIPFLVSEDQQQIFAHVAKQNPQHKELDSQEILVSLEGPPAYISPSWCSAKAVPTWNYQTAHIYGTCKTFTDPERLKWIVDSLTQKHESTLSQPWQPEYNDSMLNAVVGLEIEISEIQCKYKMSQYLSNEDKERVASELEKSGSQQMALCMRST